MIERARPTIVRPEPEPAPAPVEIAPPPAPAPRATRVEARGDHWLRHRPTPERPSSPVSAALWDALERGSRKAAVAALRELLERKDRDDELLPVWNEIAEMGIPQGLKLGDLIDACALARD